MPDTGSNIIIDISGNTANMATDFASTGVGITNAHVPINKIAFGDENTSTRVSASDPLPVTIQSNQELVGVTGDVGITGFVQIINPFETPTGVTNNFIKVASTTDGGLIGVTGYVQGRSGGFPVPVSGTVNVSNATGLGVFGISGATAIAITGGRRLNHSEDSVRIENSVIGGSGGRTILAATDSIKVFGSDATPYVPVVLAKDRSGSTAGFSGDALKVAITNASINATVNVSSTHGVTNDSVGSALKVQGLSGGEAVTIRGENGGAVPIIASTTLPVTFSGTQTVGLDPVLDVLQQDGYVGTRLNTISQNTQDISQIRTDISSGNVKVTVAESEQPSTLYSLTVTVDRTASAIGSASLTFRTGVKVKASMDNTDTVLIGNAGLTITSGAGFPLEPGESCFLNVSSPALVYAKAEGKGTQKIHYIGS